MIPAKPKALRSVKRTSKERATISENERNLIATTIAGFRSSFRCDPERFERIFENGVLIGISCEGLVDPERCT